MLKPIEDLVEGSSDFQTCLLVIMNCQDKSSRSSLPPIGDSRIMRDETVSLDDEMEDLLSLLSKMVSIQTESPAGKGYREFVDFIEKWAGSHLSNHDVEIVEVPHESYRPFRDLAAKFDEPRLNVLLKSRKRNSTSDTC